MAARSVSGGWAERCYKYIIAGTTHGFNLADHLVVSDALVLDCGTE